MAAARNNPAPFASFQEAVEFLEGLVNYEKRTASKYTDATFDLRRMRQLLHHMGNPHEGLPMVHVAGTKGKGSTSAFVAAMLEAGGRRTGLHTSPHLVSVCERIRVNGQPATEDEFRRLLGEVRDYVHRKRSEDRNNAPTYFETTSALALLHFRRRSVDWAVVEVGLGGRLDSTNVISPQCCIITPIGLDHMQKLGDTPAAIAGEKAGIMKPGVPVVLGRQRHPEALARLRRQADTLGCPTWEVDREVQVTRMAPLVAPPERPDAPLGWEFDVSTPVQCHRGLTTVLLGAHQVENCATAIGAIDMLRERGALRIAPDAIATGAARRRWPARVELLQRHPALLLDAAHTPESIQALLAALDAHFPGRPVSFVFGCSADKDAPSMLRLLAPRCRRFIAAQADSPRAMEASAIAGLAAEAGAPALACVPDGPQAVDQAIAQATPDEVVCVTGSFFLAGEVRHARISRARPSQNAD